MKKRIYDLLPHRELWSYDYNPNIIYVLEKLTEESGSRAAIVRQVAAYWTNEKEWIFSSGAQGEHSHADNLVDLRGFNPLPVDQDD